MLAEKVDTTISEIVNAIWRLASTILIFCFRPRIAAAQLSPFHPEYRILLRPNTFLLIGCFALSLYVKVLELSSGSADGTVRGLRFSETTEAISATFQMVITDVFSVVGVIVRTLPILIVMSLAAYSASLVYSPPQEITRRFFLYLYGLQGIVLILVILSLETIGSASEALFGSDDYGFLLIPFIVVGLAVQSARGLLSLWDRPRSWKVAWRYAVFLLFFILPLPTAGFIVHSMSTSTDEISEESRRWGPGPPVRVVDVQPFVINGSQLRISFSALVDNRSTKTIALRSQDVSVEVYFVAPEERGRNIQISRSLPSNVNWSVDSYDRHIVTLSEAQIEQADDRSEIWILAPGAEEFVTISVDQAVTVARFLPSDRGRYNFGSDDEWRAERSRRAAESRARLEEFAENDVLKYIAVGKTAFVRVVLTDEAGMQTLTSGYYAVAGKIGEH